MLSDGERLRVHPRRLAGSHLAGGAELSAEEVERLRRDAFEDRCEQRLLRLLAMRARSRAELDRRMAGWGLTEDECGDQLERLERSGLVDDEAVAEAVSEALRRRGHGHLRASADLARIGVAEPVAARTAADHETGDLAAARAVVERRFGSGRLPEPDLRRAAGLLARRGFDEETVAAALSLDHEG